MGLIIPKSVQLGMTLLVTLLDRVQNVGQMKTFIVEMRRQRDTMVTLYDGVLGLSSRTPADLIKKFV